MKLSPIRHPCPLGEKARLYFKPTSAGRLMCTQCAKPVKDLAGHTDAQIADYIRANPGTCIILGPKRSSDVRAEHGLIPVTPILQQDCSARY